MRKFQTSFMLPSSNEDDESHLTHPGLFITQFLFPFTALVLAGLGLLAGDKLPGWMHWVVLLCLVVIAGSALIQPIKMVSRWLAGRSRYRQAAGKFFAELERNVEMLQDLTAEDRSTSLVCVIKEINNCEEFSSKPISISGIAFLHQSLESLVRRLEVRTERVNDFETPSCMKLLSKDRECWLRWSPVWVD